MCILANMSLGAYPDWLAAIAAIVAGFYAFRAFKHSEKMSEIALEQSNKNAKEILEQRKIDYFSEYSKRFNDLVLSLPQDFNQIGSYSFSNGLKSFYFNDIMMGKPSSYASVIRNLFNLFSDEHYLKSTNQISDEVWSNWLDGIKMCLKYDSFHHTWEHIKGNSIYGDLYRNFIENLFKEVRK